MIPRPSPATCRHRPHSSAVATEALSTDQRPEQTPRLRPEPPRRWFPRKRFVKPCTSRLSGQEPRRPDGPPARDDANPLSRTPSELTQTSLLCSALLAVFF